MKVVFKIWKGEVVALFPELPGTNDPDTCLCYSHAGMHSTADVRAAGKQPYATKREYEPLLRELESGGYKDLKVVMKLGWNRKARMKALRK